MKKELKSLIIRNADLKDMKFIESGIKRICKIEKQKPEKKDIIR